MEVFRFTGAGGVALSMYNTDEVQTKAIFLLLFVVLFLFIFGHFSGRILCFSNGNSLSELSLRLQ